MLPLPPLRMLDSAGGVLLGAATGLALCWVAGAALLYMPGQSDLRKVAQDSSILSGLTEALPPERVMAALERIDTFSAIVGPATGGLAPDPAIARDPEIAAARNSVVRVRGFACGLGIEGSGWIVRARPRRDQRACGRRRRLADRRSARRDGRRARRSSRSTRRTTSRSCACPG